MPFVGFAVCWLNCLFIRTYENCACPGHTADTAPAVSQDNTSIVDKVVLMLLCCFFVFFLFVFFFFVCLFFPKLSV